MFPEKTFLNPVFVRGVRRLSHSGSSIRKSQADAEFAFEIRSPIIRYGKGVTDEVGMDVLNFKLANVCVFTDETLLQLQPMQTTLVSLAKSRIKFDVYSTVQTDPSASSILDAIKFAHRGMFDAYIAVGGGSVIDTAKAANLYATSPDAEFFDYVNRPFGKEIRITHELKPLIAIPTTFGSGSDTSCSFVFRCDGKKNKAMISDKSLMPILSLIDPLHTLSLPERVAAYNGCGVLCHALETYTSLEYTARAKPRNPFLRPTFQGRNPISDVWSQYVLLNIKKFLIRAVHKPHDIEARSGMHLAATMAGLGYSNAGVHLCEAISFTLSIHDKLLPVQNQSKHNQGMIPHGFAAIIVAPAVVRFLGQEAPQSHMDVAELLGADISNAKLADAGAILSDILIEYMKELEIENGLGAFGVNLEEIPTIAKAVMDQRKFHVISPVKYSEEMIIKILEESMSIY